MSALAAVRRALPGLGRARAPGRALDLLLLAAAAGALALANPLVLGRLLRLPKDLVYYSALLDLFLLALIAVCALQLAGRLAGRRWRNRLLLALPVWLLLAEGGITAARALAPEAFAQAARKSPSKLYRADHHAGWALTPGRTTAMHHQRYVVDAQGRRAMAPVPGASRALRVYGDSFVFGFGVADDETALSLVADALGARVQVLNYAVPGYGLEQMYMRLRATAADIAPGDIVVFAPLTWNIARNLMTLWVCDRFDVATFPALEDGVWRIERLADHCPEPHLPLTRAWRSLQKSLGLTEQALIANADAVLQAARRLVEAQGGRFEVFFQLSLRECTSGRFARDLAALRTPFASLMPYCKRITDPAALLIPGDHHLNAAGQRWVAAAWLDYLRRDLALAADPPPQLEAGP